MKSIRCVYTLYSCLNYSEIFGLTTKILDKSIKLFANKQIVRENYGIFL